MAPEHDAFWRWFVAIERRFRTGRGASYATALDELLLRLHLYDPGLSFEVGGAPGGPLELIVTASGDRTRFDSVRALIAHSPSLDGWRFIAFKPPQGFGFVTEYGTAKIEPRS